MPEVSGSDMALSGGSQPMIEAAQASSQLAAKEAERPLADRSLRSGFQRFRATLKALIARIDLPDFPGSCCG